MSDLEEAMKWAASPLAAGMHDRVLHDEIVRLRECLAAIAERHIPDQPAASGDEAEYVRGCHMQLRRMALAALAKARASGAASHE